MSNYRSDCHAQTKASNQKVAEMCEKRHTTAETVGPKIQELKAEKASCLSCAHMKGKPFGFNRCTLKDKNVKTYNICIEFKKKES
jgi:hypothetical protein